MNITILDDYQNTVKTLACYSKLSAHNVTIWNDHTKDINILADRLKDTEALALLRERTPIRAELIERLPNLRMIGNVGVYPHIDVEACTRQGVLVCVYTSPTNPSYPTAELTWALILCALRNLPQEIAALKAGRWQAWPIGTTVRGKTLGILGFGKLGAVVAGYGRAFGANVWVWGRASTMEKAREAGYDLAPSREAFFGESDIVSLHVRLLPETRGVVGSGDLARMKPTALLVNTSRAGLIEPGVLEAALRAGRPGMAAVDVFEEEPLEGGKHPLLQMDNVIATPHLGYVERNGIESIYSAIFDMMLAYAAGAPVNVVNQRP